MRISLSGGAMVTVILAELLPEVSLDEEDEWIDSPQAYGVLLA